MSIVETKLLSFFEHNQKASLKELQVKFSIEDKEELEVLDKNLKTLEIKGLLYKNKEGNYILMSKKENIFYGKVCLSSNKKELIVKNDKNEEVHIYKNEHKSLLPGDIVTLNNLKVDGKGNVFGSLDKILKRKKEQISCEVILKDGKPSLTACNSKFNNEIKIDNKDLENYGIGTILLVKLTNDTSKEVDGVLVKEIGHKNDPDLDEKTILYDHGFECEFSEKYLRELKKIPSCVNSEKAIKEGRKDLRNKKIFTIDGADTKDIDDSICLEKLPNDNYKLYVNIADVSYYIKENSVIDNEAKERATSQYLNDTVNPMFHPKISNGICSLHPNVDRLTLTCEMIINKNGEVVNYDIYESIINSKKKMTYEDVNKILRDNVNVDGYEEFKEDLEEMNRLSQILEKAKEKRGYINFNKSEIKASGIGENIKFNSRKQEDAEKIIENFMLLANETIAKHAFYLGLPFLYRIHEAPDEDKIQGFLDLLENIGYDCKRCKNVNMNTYIQNITKMISQNEKNDQILSELLLMSTMKKAKYSNLNQKHFGLALKHYTHFTSPIRRYIDLEVHRLIKLYKNFVFVDYDELEKKLKQISNHCTERSIEAEKAEREAKEMRMAEFLETKIGMEFEATITYISQTSVKIRTKEGFEGTIEIKDLKEDDFVYYPNLSCLIGQRNNIMYKIGSNLKVKVKCASKKNRSIKFTTGEVLEKKQSKIKKLKKS